MNSYIFLKVEGRNINKFLLRCENNNINLIKIVYKSYKSVIILINKKDYKKILKIKSIYKVTVISFLGLEKYKKIFIKYKVFIISFVIGILLLIFLSNIIFEIEIIGDNNVLSKDIKKEISYYGIEKYRFKKNYNQIDIIKKKIKEKYKDTIEWIEIKEKGTKYIINFVERKKKKETKNDEIYSIVSTKSGIIKDIYTYKGISLVEKENYVSKGDVLLSSDIILNDEVKFRESAEGKVYAETWYKVNVEYPYNYKEKKYTNKRKTIPYIKIGNNYFELFKYKNYDRKKELYYKDKITGFELGIERIRDIVLTNRKYNNKEAINKAEDYAKEKLLDRLDHDEYIISQKTLKFYSNGSKIIVDIFFSVYEEIGEKRILEMGEVDDTKDARERTE